MRCSSCGATNPDDATWCGQCYARLHEEPTPPPAPSEEEDPAPAFTAEGDDIQWRCGVCGTSNVLDDFACRVCGTRIDAALDDDRPETDWARARTREMLLPGLGHVTAQQAGMGIARTTMVVLWLVGGILMVLSGGSAVVAAVPLLAGAAAIWITGPLDLAAYRDGRDPLLDGRRFMWLVVGVTAVFMVSGAVGAIR